MRGRMIQGQTETAIIRLKDSDGDYINIDTFPTIRVYLVNIVDYSNLAKFRYPQASGYLKMETGTSNVNGDRVAKYGIIKIKKEHTKDSGLGDIEVHIHLEKLDGDGNPIVIVHKGKLARMLRAKTE